MGFGNFIKKVGKSVSNVGKTVWDGTQKATTCLNAINKVQSNVQGHDPRGWMTACDKETLFKLQGPDHFKSCLTNKIKQEIKDIKNPEKYAEKLWDEIKGGCS